MESFKGWEETVNITWFTCTKHGNQTWQHGGNSFQTAGDFLGKCLIHLQIFMEFFRPTIWSSEKKNLFGGANGYAGGPGLQGHLLHLSESIGIYRNLSHHCFISKSENVLHYAVGPSWLQGLFWPPLPFPPFLPQVGGMGRRLEDVTHELQDGCPMVTFWSLMRKNLRR